MDDARPRAGRDAQERGVDQPFQVAAVPRRAVELAQLPQAGQDARSRAIQPDLPLIAGLGEVQFHVDLAALRSAAPAGAGVGP